MKALVIGGTGPTGPFIVNGLIARGYEVTILHRGTHEIDEIPPEVEHIHVDPNFLESLAEGLNGRTFDLCVSTYGRLRFVAEALVGKVGRLIAVGAKPYRGTIDPQLNFPRGEAIPVPENAARAGEDATRRWAHLIVQAEQRTFELHPHATYLGYPYVYGPRQMLPREWCVVRRILDGRRRIILPEGGLTLQSHGYAENMAHSVLLAVDQPDASLGQSYNCGDSRQLTLRQMVEVIAAELGEEVSIVSAPADFALLGRQFIFSGRGEHTLLDLFKIRSELGYTDVVPAAAAFARTARWLVDNPLERGGQLENNLDDPFDYEAEDRFLEAYARATDELSAFRWEDLTRAHIYAHPKTPGMVDHRGR